LTPAENAPGSVRQLVKRAQIGAGFGKLGQTLAATSAGASTKSRASV
jgi:hypothetical protein